ncbi:GQ67_03002T0 (plasmid) [Komagataella phaffii]|uniref:RNA-polymerase subunit-like protein n=1 Tax=Komagataella phaffii TaxID=460519 RepID=A0A1B2MJE2_9ASCO|nr:GQ67_03002T0 [Komagataella phaffii]AOA70429.1 GQ67_p03002T0 [Komagataella phaffii GS115]AVX51672.1 RNA-polymerase subunit-like protein [Komagataella phaffii]
MNQDILDNLEYFSEVTQKTLSAFHVSGTDVTLVEEMEEIKRFVTNAKTKKVLTIQYEGKKFKRIFTDGSFDIVEESRIMEPAYYTSKGYTLIEKALSQKMSPVACIKGNNKIEKIPFKEIEKPSEKIFFM